MSFFKLFPFQSRRKVNRSEWAIRHLNLPVSEGTAHEPGLLLIQIDGLSREEMQRAQKKGRMPFLSKLQKKNKYDLHTFYPGLPSTTPAVQAELYYGVRAGVPAFSFFNRMTGEINTMFDPELVKNFEKQFANQGKPLLKGGSSWSNIYSGGAEEEESHFCISCLGMGDFFPTGKPGARLLFALLHFASIVRIMGLIFLELAIGLWDVVSGIFQGQRLHLELGMVLSRMCVGIGIREWLMIGGKLDLARGLPIIHLNFLGYDEMAHRRGPESEFAHWALRGIDSAIASLFRAAHRSRRRNYQVWIFSDHGQEHVRSFETEIAGGIKGIVDTCLLLERSEIRYSRERPLTRPFSRRLYEKERKQRAVRQTAEEGFSITAMGPVAHIYFSHPIEDDEKQALAYRLVNQGKVPAVLHLRANNMISWYDVNGEAKTLAEIAQRLRDYPEAFRTEIAEDLERLCRNENAGDLVLLGFNGQGDCWTFAAERGAHGSMGPKETRGFLLTPPNTQLPEGSINFVRPCGLRAAIFDFLGTKDGKAN